MENKIVFLDLCLPDYFRGYHKPVISIPVYSDLTCKELAEEIQNEINAIYEYFEEEQIPIFDEYCKQLLETPDEIAVNFTGDTPEDDYEDSCYLYLSTI